MLDFKRLTLNRGKGKQKGKQKAAAVESDNGKLNSGIFFLKRPTSFYDINVDSQPLSARSFMEEMETDMGMMNIHSPRIQFATPFWDDSDSFATPRCSGAMTVDSRSPSPLSPVMNNSSSGSKRKRVSHEAALTSQMKMLQVLGPEASSVIAKYEEDKK
jgi:hypothetical protein